MKLVSLVAHVCCLWYILLAFMCTSGALGRLVGWFHDYALLFTFLHRSGFGGNHRSHLPIMSVVCSLLCYRRTVCIPLAINIYSSMQYHQSSPFSSSSHVNSIWTYLLLFPLYIRSPILNLRYIGGSRKIVSYYVCHRTYLYDLGPIIMIKLTGYMIFTSFSRPYSRLLWHA